MWGNNILLAPYRKLASNSAMSSIRVVSYAFVVINCICWSIVGVMQLTHKWKNETVQKNHIRSWVAHHWQRTTECLKRMYGWHSCRLVCISTLLAPKISWLFSACGFWRVRKCTRALNTWHIYQRKECCNWYNSYEISGCRVDFFHNEALQIHKLVILNID